MAGGPSGSSARHPVLASGCGSSAGRVVTALSRRRLQIALGLLWLLDAVLQCQADMFRPDFYGNLLLMNDTAPPGWLWNWITDIGPTVMAHTVAANAGAVVVQFAIGAGLLWRPTVRPALALSIPWALIVWLFGEMGGGLFVGGGSALTGAPGAALLYAVTAVLLWPRRAHDGMPSADRGLLPAPLPLIVWATVWVGTAALEAGYLNRSPDYASQTMANVARAGPSWLHAAGQAAGDLIGTHGALFAACAGIAQAAIGLAIVVPRARRAALLAGAALALLYGVVGQALGGIFSNGVLGIMNSGATDPGTAPVMILLALTLWPHRDPAIPTVPAVESADDGRVYRDSVAPLPDPAAMRSSAETTSATEAVVRIS